jgi:Pyruvate/2-oxoacid:ferredoxin oxidoreductase delta subunit
MGRVRPRKYYYSEEELRNIAADLTSAVAIPVNVVVEAEHRVLDLGEMETILRSSENIFLEECGCRKMHHNCDAPLDTCLAVNVEADYPNRFPDSNARRVNVSEALDAMRRSHEAGLVHMAYVFKGEEVPQLICSCCTCCCHTLGGIVGHGITTQVLTSKLIAEDDNSKCLRCGKCAERCPLGAREMVDGEKVFDKTRCFGCGLCVSTCPIGAIRLVSRRKA